MDKQSRLLIFDIDGTLLLNGPVIREIFFYAFKQVCGRLPETENIYFHGMTDRGIFRTLLNQVSIHNGYEALFRQFKTLFVRSLHDRYPYATGPFLLPGVETLLSELNRLPDIYLALGTGNIRESAYIKLRRFGLDVFFPIGGFGGDHELRTDVISSAIQESGDYYQLAFEPSSIWIIGDTLADIDAAHQAGAKALAVATGLESLEALEHSSAEAVLNNLENTSLVISVFCKTINYK